MTPLKWKDPNEIIGDFMGQGFQGGHGKGGAQIFLPGKKTQ
jgi:hypothetical protein